ncbi:hypothetical protein L2E82_53795 [Cichorium intybus]|nr:hypothetical protein L2E82_53795 [Cichorium intybus]
MDSDSPGESIPFGVDSSFELKTDSRELIIANNGSDLTINHVDEAVKVGEGGSVHQVDEFMTDSSNETQLLASKHSHDCPSFLNLDWNGLNKESRENDVVNKNGSSTLMETKVAKSFAETVNSSTNSLNANIKIIPKLNGTKVGEVEMPYSSLMLGSAPYHSTLYGFS